MEQRSRHTGEPTPREREMGAALAEAERRGESEEAVARRLGIRVSTLRWWASQIRCRAARRAKAHAGRTALAARAFVEVQVEVARSRPGFEAILENGREVRVPIGFDASELARLIGVLEQPC